MPPLLQRLYAARGVTAAHQADLSLANLVPVGRFAGLEPALARLRAAFRRRERIVIVGDFDADGATSTALLMRGLRRLGFVDLGYVVPDRFRFGYGLNPDVVRSIDGDRATLLLTVDNGVTSLEGVAEAARRGMDVVVTDHHLPGDELPAACAIVNPNLVDEPFPHKNLAGVGVAFYLLAGLARDMERAGEAPAGASRAVADGLDLVALGTVADVVPLDHNNRILVEQGLKRIRAGRCAPGIAALLEVGRRDPARATAADLGFAAGPRLNAAGRLQDMRIGIECLLADDPQQARALAAQLDALNRERREIEAQMKEHAQQQIERASADLAGQLPTALTVHSQDWHQGVVGLIAGRLKERYHRPVVAFAPGDGGLLKGSGRSVPGMHMRDALHNIATRHPGLIERFGGHAMAAGLSLAAQHLPAFETAFADEAGRWLDAEQLRGTILTDGELAAADLCLETAQLLHAAGPWGSGFAEPQFHGRLRVQTAREVGVGHLRMQLVHPQGSPPLTAIAFGAPQPWPGIGEEIELVYRLQVSEWQETRRAELIVEYMQGVAG